MYPQQPGQDPQPPQPPQQPYPPAGVPPQPVDPLFTPIPESNPEAPIDYLDQMTREQAAAQKPKGTDPLSFLSNLTRLHVAIIGAVVLVIFIAIAAAAYFRGDPPDITGMNNRLTQRVAAQKSIADDAQKKIRNGRLAGLNTTLYVHLTGMQANLEKELAGTKDSAKTVLKSKEHLATLEKLEDARLNGVYDRVYITEAQHALTQIEASITELMPYVTKEEVKTLLKDSQDKIKTYLTQLKEIEQVVG